MQSTPLDKKRHKRHRFDCGIEALNNYLKVMANQQSTRDNSRTYVLESPEDPARIIGFYTLTMISVDLGTLPPNLQKKHRNHDTAALIARLAVDKQYAGKGFGTWLLIDALKKLLAASETVAFPLIIVDAKEGVSDFYERFGFRSFANESSRLYMSIADVRASSKGNP